MLKITAQPRSSGYRINQSQKPKSIAFKGQSSLAINFKGQPKFNKEEPFVITTDTAQMCGVRTTLQNLQRVGSEQGYNISVITPDEFNHIRCPGYPDIRLASLTPKNFFELDKMLTQMNPQSVFIATEGPMGMLAQLVCLKDKKPFTTAYTTKFPEYADEFLRKKARGLTQQLGVPDEFLNMFRTLVPDEILSPSLSAGLKQFHSKSSGVMVATETLRQDLRSQGYKNILPWTRGVDLASFSEKMRDSDFIPKSLNTVDKSKIKKPYLLYVGRVSEEKGLKDFLRLPSDLGTKIVVGDGPILKELMQEFPDAIFTGRKKGEGLAKIYASSNLFVFPSKTDTFGVVMLESLASGTPVAAYPVTGPIDVIGKNSNAGVLDNNLAKAVEKALKLDPKNCRAFAEKFSWENCFKMWLDNLAVISGKATKSLSRVA